MNLKYTISFVLASPWMCLDVWSFSLTPIVSSLALSKAYPENVLGPLKMSSSSTTTSTSTVGAIGSKLTDTDLAMEALEKFLGTTGTSLSDITMEATTGGVNNIVQYITLPSGEKQLLRIYNNGLDTKRVYFEHDVLRKLQQAGPFSFQVPNFLSTVNSSSRSNSSDDDDDDAPDTDDMTASPTTVVELSNGAMACMCTLIPGHLPKLSCVREIGRACGELNTALTALTPEVNPNDCNCAPYADMWGVHHATTQDNFIECMSSPAFDAVRDTATRMTEETIDISDKCLGKYSALPTQLIHGDLHYDNVLVQDDGTVTGLLDFEFAAFDWRAMELAISLSKYAGEEPDAMPYFDDFIDGYCETGALTREEAEAIPDLINLRILSNVVYFCGRAIAGEDDISSLTTRIENYEKRVQWVKNHGDRIVARIVEKMGL